MMKSTTPTSWPKPSPACPRAAGAGGLAVKQAHNLADAKRFFSTNGGEGFDLVITDLRMDTPNDGFELLEFVRKHSPSNPKSSS